MSIQDGLLSFAIKETIFLSSDKAGIEEWKELELVPDVEVLETDTAISITGCLQLFGKYKPTKEAFESAEGSADTLVEAVTFSPFRPGGSEGQLYGREEQLQHRIPLNITIPLHRIAEIEDIYAVVDSFDYQLQSAHQLLIEADLVIAGIKIGEPRQTVAQPASYEDGAEENEPDQEQWEYAYAAQEQEESGIQPISLEDIEKKLAELESEMKRQVEPEEEEEEEQARAKQESSSGFAAMFQSIAGRTASNQPADRQQSFGDVTDDFISQEEPVLSDSEPSYSIEPVSWQETEENANLYEGMRPDDEPVVRAAVQSEADAERETASPWRAAEQKVPMHKEVPSVKQAPPSPLQEASQVVHKEAVKAAAPKAEAAAAPSEEPRQQEIAPASASQESAAEAQQPAPETAEESVVTAAEASVETTAANDAEESAETAVDESQEVSAEESGEPESVEASAAPPVPEAAEEKEVRVAITSKAHREEGGKLNLTSIFSQATRTKQEEKAVEESSSATRRGPVDADHAAIETMQNLSSFVQNKEEKKSRLKLCIIQRDETLETISQRYSLPPSRILEVNNLRSDQIVAGQIIYIPQ